jgi:hypothetical protein
MSHKQQPSKSIKKEKKGSLPVRTDASKDLDAIEPLTVEKSSDRRTKRLMVKAESKDKRSRNDPPASKVSDRDSIHFKSDNLTQDCDGDQPSLKRSDAKNDAKKHTQSEPASPSPSDGSDLNTEDESILVAHGLGKLKRSPKRSPTPMQFSPISELDSEEEKELEKKIENDRSLLER